MKLETHLSLAQLQLCIVFRVFDFCLFSFVGEFFGFREESILPFVSLFFVSSCNMGTIFLGGGEMKSSDDLAVGWTYQVDWQSQNFGDRGKDLGALIVNLTDFQTEFVVRHCLTVFYVSGNIQNNSSRQTLAVLHLCTGTSSVPSRCARTDQLFNCFVHGE